MLDKVRPLVEAMLARLMFTRYLLASLCALCLDMTLFLALSRAGLSATGAAFCGYASGLFLHWMLSVRFVFPIRGRPTPTQRLGFVVSALFGLGITVTMVAGLCATGMPPAPAKLLSIPLSFLAVYAIRKHGVFGRA